MHSKGFVRIAQRDNVGTVVQPDGLPLDTPILDGVCTLEMVPMGHKVALCNIKKGEDIIKYGHSIGMAQESIFTGQWVKENHVIQPPAPSLDAWAVDRAHPIASGARLTGYAFAGFRNHDGSVGTKNILGISNTVQCVAGMTDFVVKKIKEDLLPHFPNVDDVVGLKHTYGCGVAIHAPAAIIPIRTLQNIATNPNLGGEVLVIGLGCEKLRPEWLVPNAQAPTDLDQQILYLQDQKYHGFSDMVNGILDLAEKHLKKLNQRQREICPASELVVGMQCGGSDGLSGITANPVAGFASDLIVRAGGSVLFSEVTEVRDAIHLLMPRTISQTIGQKLIRELKWYDQYLQSADVDRRENTAPGNKHGGLSSIVEKSLGSIAKSGTSPIVDVLAPGEKIRTRGLNFAATPAGDFVCGTLQVAAGMNVHVFTTGRGTPYGLAMVPVIKVGSNSQLAHRWHDLIDFDAGPIASGEHTIESLGWDLFHFILEVASGKKQVACDRLGLHNDLVLFNPGPLT